MKKFYLLTILKDKKLFANIYETKKTLFESIDKLQDLPMRLFELVPTNNDIFDVCVVKIGKKYVAALGAKKKIKNDKYFTKCTKREVSLAEI